jgi:uncharacterized protein (DUF1501 family)
MAKRRRNDDVLSSDRRKFLGQASCAAIGTTALFNTVLNLRMFNALAAPGEDYRALVCLFLSGGIDSFNALVPTTDAGYGEYAGVRGDLALPRDVLPDRAADARRRDVRAAPGAHRPPVAVRGEPALDRRQRRHPGRAHHAGSVPAGHGRAPARLFSHSDQSMQWQSSLPDSRQAVGWAGRIADVIDGGNCNANISMNISLSGSNVWQSGRVTSHYTISENGAEPLWDYGRPNPQAVVRTEAIDSLLALQYRHLFEKTFAARMRGAIDAGVDFSNAIAGLPPLTTQFSNTSLSRKFRMIALTIAARAALCMKRQTFFVELGGWDHHDEVILNQEAMLPVVDAALSEFHNALVELDVVGEVTTFTASDFGRTLSSNGRGSDHAWGGNHLVMGGAVAGGDLYGAFPQLYPSNPLDTGRGRLIPTTSVDAYAAQLALWFGVPRADLPLVLPNIGRFWSTNSPTLPLGAGSGFRQSARSA